VGCHAATVFALWVSKFGARSRKMRICRWDLIFGTPQPKDARLALGLWGG
jgi:hypothetical protein